MRDPTTRSGGHSPIIDLAIVDADGPRLSPGEIGLVEIGGGASHPYRYLAEGGSDRRLAPPHRARMCVKDCATIREAR
jgi:hypothetical protein